MVTATTVLFQKNRPNGAAQRVPVVGEPQHVRGQVGGNRSASDEVSIDVTIIQKNGKINTIVAGTSTRCHGLNGSRSRRRGRAGSGACHGRSTVARLRHELMTGSR